jgi:thiamine-phosphate pyrophosphorylase
MKKMLRYAITSRALFPGNDREQQAALLEQAAQWASDGIDFIQLREKDLPAADLVKLARNLLKTIALSAGRTKLLINSRPDIAIASGVPGVHLTASPGELTPNQVRSLFAVANLPAPIISLSCHTLLEITCARDFNVDAILFAPVFEKPLPGQPALPGQGLDRLHEACAAADPIPVYALGGVTWENAASTLKAGAAGIAGVLLFHTYPLC